MTDIGSCRLTWTIRVSLGDRDGDGVLEKVAPDPDTGLTVEFVPQGPEKMPVPGATPPYTLIPHTIVGKANAAGEMVRTARDADNVPVATSDEWVDVDDLGSDLLAAPVADDQASYLVVVSNLFVNGELITIRPFGIHPPAGVTTDLTELVTIDQAGGVQIRRGPQGRGVAGVRDIGNGEFVLVLDDEDATETAPITTKTGPVGPQGLPSTNAAQDMAALGTLLRVPGSLAAEAVRAAEPQPITPRVIRTGTAWNHVTGAPVPVGEVATHDMLAARTPQWQTLPEDAFLCGITAAGDMMYRRGGSHFLTSDGGATSTPVTTSMTVNNLWVDSQGNHYTASGGVFRAPAGTWNFVKVFQFRIADPAIFCFTEDGEGGVWFCEYYSGADDRSKGVARSTSWGAPGSWTLAEVDYGQRHHHAIHFHKPSNTLWLVPGEPAFSSSPKYQDSIDNGGGRGFLKSTDKGATWVDVLGRGTVYQPLMGVTVGKYILWGQDAAPTAWVVLNTETNEVTYLRNHGTVGSNPSNAGFVYSQRAADGLVYASSEAITTSDQMTSLSVVGDLDAVLNVWAPSSKRSLQHTSFFGPDKNGWFYSTVHPTTVGGLGTPIALTKSKIRSKRAIVVGRTQAAGAAQAAVGSWDNTTAADVLAETWHGKKIVRLGHGHTWDQGNNGAGAPGDVLKVTMMIRRERGGSTVTHRLLAFPKNAQGVTVGGSRSADLNLSGLPVGRFHRVTVTLPAFSTDSTIVSYALSWNRVGGVAGVDDVNIVSQVLVTREPGSQPDATWAPAPFEDVVTFDKVLGPETMLRNRIYTAGAAADWAVGAKYPLMDLNGVAIGLRRVNTTFGNHEFYVEIGGAVTYTGVAHQWGSALDPRLQHGTMGRLENSVYLRPYAQMPPLIVGAAPGKLLVVDPARAQTHDIPVGTRFDGGLSVKLLGPAAHMPEVLGGVRQEWRAAMMREI